MVLFVCFELTQDEKIKIKIKIKNVCLGVKLQTTGFKVRANEVCVRKQSGVKGGFVVWCVSVAASVRFVSLGGITPSPLLLFFFFFLFFLFFLHTKTQTIHSGYTFLSLQLSDSALSLPPPKFTQ